MSRQIKDEFRYGKKWGLFKKSLWLTAINGSGLFDPAQHGITPVMISTGCWRGYSCTYEVRGRALLLTKVHLGLGEEDRAAAARGEGPLLFGKVPRRCTKCWGSSHFKIDSIRQPIPFTGGLLVGDDVVYGELDYMMINPAYGPNILHELVFDSGRLIEEHDRSAQIMEFRKMLLSRLPKASNAEIMEQIKRCFTMEYEDWPP